MLLNVYKSIYKSMKKGAVLGIVQHRANENIDANFKWLCKRIIFNRLYRKN